MIIRDAHTHRSDARDAVINWQPGMTMDSTRLYSVGIHPWHADAYIPDMELLIAQPCVVAVGECGLDRLHGPDRNVQMRAFTHCLDLAEKYHKPVIIHIVRSLDEILALHRLRRPSVPWVIHGFRGKPQKARQLLDAGMYISLGPVHNPDTAALIPSDRLLVETDEAPHLPSLPQYDSTTPDKVFSVCPTRKP